MFVIYRRGRVLTVSFTGLVFHSEERLADIKMYFRGLSSIDEPIETEL